MAAVVKRCWVLFAICAIALLALAGCDAGKAPQAGDPGKLDIGIAFPQDDWRSAFIQEFAREIEEKSGGSIQTKIHYMDEYPDMKDLLKEMSQHNGRLDVVLSANAYLGDYTYPELYVTGLPYLFNGFEDAWAFAESDLNTQIESKLPDYGMRVLSHFCGGFRSLSSVRSIEGPDDMRGQVVGTVRSPILMDMLFRLGANPQPSIPSEQHDAVNRGIYTGLELSLPTFLRDKDYECLPYVAVTNHAYNLWSLLIDEGSWQGLAEEERAIVKETAEKYAALERLASKENNDETIAKIRETGVEVTYPDHDAFRPITESVRERYSAAYRETYQEVVRYLDSLHS